MLRDSITRRADSKVLVLEAPLRGKLLAGVGASLRHQCLAMIRALAIEELVFRAL
jgi:hypothetical protein